MLICKQLSLEFECIQRTDVCAQHSVCVQHHSVCAQHFVCAGWGHWYLLRHVSHAVSRWWWKVIESVRSNSNMLELTKVWRQDGLQP